MNLRRQDILFEIEKALQILEPELAASLRPILDANLDRGRVETYVGETFTRTEEYIQRVAVQYARLNPYLQAVQKERSDAVWQPLFDQLQVWAYNFLLRKNFIPDDSTRAIAEECATEAALRILDAHFPYDTEFEPWAYTIVSMSCLRFFRDGTKKSVIPPQNLVELDEELPDLDPTHLMEGADQSDLLDALSELPEARRQVIQLHYFKGMSLPEIANTLGKSVGATHSLHFNALRELRKILGKNRNTT
jgi:RNA polymerase sigma-70 factor (ECF subfamily)